jgi:hypothetical protein
MVTTPKPEPNKTGVEVATMSNQWFVKTIRPVEKVLKVW